MLNDPSRHRLVVGGMGEVMPAELYQQVADYQRSAVDHLGADHALDWRGVPYHEGLRWAKAVACVEMPPPGPDPIIAPGEGGKILFASGFAEAPEVVRDSRSTPTTRTQDSRIRGWWLRWRLRDPGPQHVMVGIRTRGLELLSPHVLVPVDDGQGRGMLLLGRIVEFGQGEDSWEERSSHLQDLTHVTVVIR